MSRIIIILLSIIPFIAICQAESDTLKTLQERMKLKFKKMVK